MESWIFLALILAVSIFGKNTSLIVATLAVMLFKLVPYSTKVLSYVEAKGMNVGITIISMAILVPIATGRITFKDLLEAFKTPSGYIAVACGILVAILSAKGVGLLAQSPEITVALVFGTIFGVVFLKGIAAGPVIASGMTYVILMVINQFIQN
ncbi:MULTISPECIES: DUF441 domain-containing protein [Holzapfeliella]